MNVLETLTGVIYMLHATTIKEVTPVHATPDTRAMGFLAQVNASNWQSYCSMHSDIVILQLLIIVENAIEHTNTDWLKSI